MSKKSPRSKILTKPTIVSPRLVLDHHLLFINLRKCLENWFLSNREPGVCNTYEINTIEAAATEIFLHGLKQVKQEENLRKTLEKLVDDFEWVRRTSQIHESNTAVSSILQNIEPASRECPPSINIYMFSWVSRNLKSKCLSSCLQVLFADKALLEYYYSNWSFLKSEFYRTASFIALSALELNQYSLLTEIDDSLQSDCNVIEPSSSHPSFLTNKFEIINNKTESNSIKMVQLEQRNQLTCRALHRSRSESLQHYSNQQFFFGNKRTAENSDRNERYKQDASKNFNFVHFTPPGSFESKSNSAYSSEPIHTNSSQNYIDLINCDDIKIWLDQSEQNIQQKQQVDYRSDDFSTCSTENLSTFRKNKSKIHSPLGNALSSIPSLKTTFQSVESTIENLSPTFQTYNCKNNATNQHCDQFGVLNSFLPQYGKKIRPINAQNLFDNRNSVFFPENYQRVKNEKSSSICLTKTSDQQSLTNFLQSAQLSRNNTELEKENAHFRISEAIISAIEHIKWDKAEPDNRYATTVVDCIEHSRDCVLPAIREKLPIVESIAKNSNEYLLYAELGESCLDMLSAEVVGLSIISKFNEIHLPKVSDLKWLISEEDTPQSLLPMPSHISILNSDENVMPLVTRGTKFWAPPRQQIIFTDHPPQTRTKLIQKQNNRCAGCGMVVSTRYIKSFRYCTYLGKYLCTGCHRNQMSAIPAKIIHMWDFKIYPVSVFAYRLLEQMWNYPLFYVPALNPNLYNKNRDISCVRLKRVQLGYMKDFISTCRFATLGQKYFDSIPEYIVADPDMWSISDFFDTRDKKIHRLIDAVMSKCENHILNCGLCGARGFICEICRKDQIIYPWEAKIFRCDKCGFCFHRKCWESLKRELCFRCQRIENRQKIKRDEALLNS